MSSFHYLHTPHFTLFHNSKDDMIKMHCILISIDYPAQDVIFELCIICSLYTNVQLTANQRCFNLFQAAAFISLLLPANHQKDVNLTLNISIGLQLRHLNRSVIVRFYNTYTSKGFSFLAHYFLNTFHVKYNEIKSNHSKHYFQSTVN